MLQKRLLLSALLLLSCIYGFAQRATVSGIVRDDNGKPIEFVVVANEATGVGTNTNAKGFYILEVPAGKNVSLIYHATGYALIRKSIQLNPDETRTIDISLVVKARELTEFVLKNPESRYQAGDVLIDVSKVAAMPTVNSSVEDIIKLAVGSHDELTNQYSVRGGSFDENLVYVNDFEIYRPFLVRSGQQEGLSFINPDLVSNVNFSVGGFQAKYGDKMSSVLDVTYKRPTQFSGSVMVSLLGASLHLEGASKNQKLTYLIGARQKSNQYLLQSQPTKGVYNPSFTDLQALIDYHVNSKRDIEAIAN